MKVSNVKFHQADMLIRIMDRVKLVTTSPKIFIFFIKIHQFSAKIKCLNSEHPAIGLKKF